MNSELATLEGEEEDIIIFDSPLYGCDVELSGDELGISFGKGFGGFGKGFGKSFSRAGRGFGKSISRTGRGLGKSISRTGRGLAKGFQSAGRSAGRLVKQAGDAYVRPLKEIGKFAESGFRGLTKGFGQFLQPGQGQQPEEEPEEMEEQDETSEDQIPDDPGFEDDNSMNENPEEEISEDPGEEEMNGNYELGILEFLPVAQQGLGLLSNVSRGTNQGRNINLSNILSSLSPSSRVKLKKSTMRRRAPQQKLKSSAPAFRSMGPEAPSGKPDDGDKNKTLYIVGGVAVVGLGALLLMNKKGRR